MLEKLDHITVDPKICLGQPTVRGTRITVSVILKMLAGGNTVQDVLEAYPELGREDVYQAMKYAAWVVSDQVHLAPPAEAVREAGMEAAPAAGLSRCGCR